MAKLSVLIGADDRELQAALKRARSSLRKLGKEMRTSINDAAKWSAGAAAAGAAVATYLVKGALDAVDAQAKLAAQLNTSVASMAALERAGQTSGLGMEKISQASRALEVRMAQAAEGTGPAVDAMKKLGFTAEELAALPLDERLATINERIRETIPASQQAAVSAKLFGEEAGVAMRLLSPETLREAAEEARIFGTALSDVDAKKVEMANDAMSRVGTMMDGFLRQVAVQAAPVLKAIADEIANAAKEAGGFGNIAASAFDKVITGAGFVMDAIDGVRRVFSLVADGLIVGAASVAGAIAYQVSLILKMMDSIPGIDLSESQAAVQQFADESVAVVNEAVANMQATLEKPMPSEGLKRFVEEAKAAGQAAAEAAAAGQQGGGGEGSSQEGGMSDKERESMQKRLDALRQQYMTEEELAQVHLDTELAQIKEFENARLITETEAQALRAEAEQAHTDEVYDIRKRASDATLALQKAEHDALKGMTSDFMSNLAGLMNTDNRKMFELGKVAALSQAAVAGSKAVMDAWAAGMTVAGPWAPAVAAAYAGAAALNAGNLINNIRKQQFGGTSTPTAPTQGSSNVSTDNGAGGGSTSGSSSSPTSIINLKGDYFSRDSVRALLEQLNEEGTDGGRYVVT